MPNLLSASNSAIIFLNLFSFAISKAVFPRESFKVNEAPARTLRRNWFLLFNPNRFQWEVKRISPILSLRPNEELEKRSTKEIKQNQATPPVAPLASAAFTSDPRWRNKYATILYWCRYLQENSNQQKNTCSFPFLFTQPNEATCDLLHPKFSDPFQADKNTKTSIGAISHSSHFEQQVGK